MTEISTSTCLSFEAPPCDHCTHFHECRLRFKACERFFNYVEGDTYGDLVPSYAWYDFIYQEAHDACELKISRMSPPDPIDKMEGVYESSVGAEIDPLFENLMRKWNTIWAFKGSLPVGVLAYNKIVDRLELDFLYVREAYQRKGIGERLVINLIKDKLPIWTTPSDDSVVFYEKLGFQKKGALTYAYLHK